MSCQHSIEKDNINEPIKQTNNDGSITIQGKVTVKDRDYPPIGLTTMNIKNKWSFVKELKSQTAYGENERVFVNKDGYYRITIDKNDTLVLLPPDILYKKPNFFTGFTHNQTLNIELEETPERYISQRKQYQNNGFEIFEKHISKINPDKIVRVAGRITSSNTHEPLVNKDISLLYQNNTNNTSIHHLTDSLGQFFIETPENSQIIIDAFNLRKHFFITQDTIINLEL